MLRACVRTGLAAGLLAGVLAGAFGLLIGTPSLEQAIALEEAAVHGHGEEGVPRWLQQVGLLAGGAVVGAVVGAVFGLAFAWSAGRLGGEAWVRTVKLGGVLVGAFVILPALVQPPTPPGVGDVETVTVRTATYLGATAAGLLLAVAGWMGGRWLRDHTDLSPPARQSLVGTAVAAVALLLTAVMSVPAEPAPVPAELLWSFRLAAIATQVMLYGGVAVVFGLLTARAARPAPVVR